MTAEGIPTPYRPLLFYDLDCGFCRVMVAVFLRWDTRGRICPRPITSPEGDALLGDIPEDQRMRSWHLAGEDGAVHSAGAVFAPLLAMLPGGRVPGRLAARFPRATERGYFAVAGRRSKLGPPLPRRLVAAADARIAQRRGALRTPLPAPDATEPRSDRSASGPGGRAPRG